MSKFVGTGTKQQISVEKLLVLSKILRNCMVVKGLILILPYLVLIISHKIKQFTNFWHF